jgi:hypothetical protein
LKGKGFSYSASGNLLYRGGLMVVQSSTSKVRSAISGDADAFNDLDLVAVSNTDSKAERVLSDAQKDFSARIGVEIKETFFVDSIQQHPILYSRVQLTNNLTANSDSSRVGIVSALTNGTSRAAEIVARTSRDPVVISAVACDESGAVAQSAGLDAEFISGNFPNDRKILSLNSGTALQSGITGDVSVVAGVRFTRAIQPNETKLVGFAFGASKDSAILVQQMHPERLLDVHNNITTQNLRIHPQPASDIITIQLPNDEQVTDLSLSTLIGEELKTAEVPNQKSSVAHVNVSTLPSGIYMLTVLHRKLRSTVPIVVIH